MRGAEIEGMLDEQGKVIEEGMVYYILYIFRENKTKKIYEMRAFLILPDV